MYMIFHVLVSFYQSVNKVYYYCQLFGRLHFFYLILIVKHNIFMDTPPFVIEDDDDVSIIDNAIVTKKHVQKTSVHIVDLLEEDDDEGSNKNETSEKKKENNGDINKEEKSKYTESSEKEDNIPNYIADAKHNKTKWDNVNDKQDEKTNFVMLLKTNNLMNKIIQKCLNMDKNNGMHWVINKTLLPLYNIVDCKYKKSDIFLAVLNRVLSNLKRDPHHKFSHIKSLCEELKGRKRVPFVTLTKDIKIPSRQQPTDNFKRKKRKKKEKQNKCAKKKTEIINLDHSDDDITTVDIDDSDNENDVVILEETNNTDELVIHDKLDKDNNKESCVEASQPSVSNDNAKVNKIACQLELLVPNESVNTDSYHHLDDPIVIKKYIKYYKAIIDDLEEQEVTDDTKESPYVQSDRYKAIIVELYKKLCNLTDNGNGNLIKPRPIRLYVTENRAPGPVKRLEQYLNSTIDQTGCVPLPDFEDVLECVKESNIIDKLCWTKQQILNEAILLFTTCGNALRKSRQNRAYKDLMYFVRDKSLDDFDPANQDPVLSARLEENKLIAKANENKVFDRYAKLGSTTSSKISKKLPIEQADSDRETDTRPSKIIKNGVTQTTTNIEQPVISQKVNQNVMELPSTVNQSLPNSVIPYPVINEIWSLAEIQSPLTNTTISNSGLQCPVYQEASNLRMQRPAISQTAPNCFAQPIVVSMQLVSEPQSNLPNVAVFTSLPVTVASCSPRQYIFSDRNIPENVHTYESTNSLTTPYNLTTVEDNSNIIQIVHNNSRINDSENSLNKTLRGNVTSKEYNNNTPNNNNATENINKQGPSGIENNIYEKQIINNMNQIEPHSLNKHRTPEDNSNCINNNINNCTSNYCEQINNQNCIHNSIETEIGRNNINNIHEADSDFTNNDNNSIQSSNFTTVYKHDEEDRKPEVTHSNEMCKTNCDIIKNINISGNGNVEAIQIKEKAMDVQNSNSIIDDSRKNIVYTPQHSSTFNVKESLIQDIQNSKFNDSLESNVDSTLDNKNKSQNTITETVIYKESTGQQYNNTTRVADIEITDMGIDKQNNINVTQPIENNLNVDLLTNNFKTSTNHMSNKDQYKIRILSIEELQNNINETDFIEKDLTQDSMQNDVDLEPKDNAILKCKRENIRDPDDIQQLLDRLGDNYISTIFDIEDPFLVIEISSDSSSDEDL